MKCGIFFQHLMRQPRRAQSTLDAAARDIGLIPCVTLEGVDLTQFAFVIQNIRSIDAVAFCLPEIPPLFFQATLFREKLVHIGILCVQNKVDVPLHHAVLHQKCAEFLLIINADAFIRIAIILLGQVSNAATDKKRRLYANTKVVELQMILLPHKSTPIKSGFEYR